MFYLVTLCLLLHLYDRVEGGHMDYKDFLKRVQDLSGLSEQESRASVEATLQTLGERMERPERNKLAAELKNELKTSLLKRSAGEHFTLEDFFTRIGARAGGVHYSQSVERCRIVLAVLREAVSEGDIEAAIKKLPHEFRELFHQPFPVS